MTPAEGSAMDTPGIPDYDLSHDDVAKAQRDAQDPAGWYTTVPPLTFTQQVWEDNPDRPIISAFAPMIQEDSILPSPASALASDQGLIRRPPRTRRAPRTVPKYADFAEVVADCSFIIKGAPGSGWRGTQ